MKFLSIVNVCFVFRQDSLILQSVKISNANEVNELDTIHVANFI